MKKMHKKTLRLPVFMTLVLSFLFIQSYAFAQNAVTPQHIAEMTSVTGSVISDDGGHIAYTVSVPADPYAENAGSRK